MKNKDSILMALKCISGYYEGPACKDCPYLKETEPNVHLCDGEQVLKDSVKLMEKLCKIPDKIVQGDGIETKRENGD